MVIISGYSIVELGKISGYMIHGYALVLILIIILIIIFFQYTLTKLNIALLQDIRKF